MFGIIRPCRHRLPEPLRTAWWAHLCGLCLALRDAHGQLARAATNYDGLVISALVEAQQTGSTARREAGPCPLRGMRSAEVAVGEGARLAAAVSLLLASAKIADHVTDRDGPFATRPGAHAGRRLAARWHRQSTASAEVVGFDSTLVLAAIDRQPALEAAAALGSSVLTVTEPTETATAAAFAHTAVLAGRPHNAAPLGEAGRLFGRVVHLLDAVEDLRADADSGAWNPLTATGTGLPEARRLCDDAVLGVRLALREADFADQRLVHALLAHELEHAVERIFAQQPEDPPTEPFPIPPMPPADVLPEQGKRRRWPWITGCSGLALAACGGCVACLKSSCDGGLRCKTDGCQQCADGCQCKDLCNCDKWTCGCTGKSCSSCCDGSQCADCGNCASGCGNCGGGCQCQC
ncbi:DUF5685 family protein [Crossiella cryophila]|uniref:Regulatory protein n=1 Tax=Crossiella cryophila TaxID=43355 RepID=A0A7W7FXL1_9PSEU|nr:DUF5685 family protein [Crossiella cryophila]MBB4681215.1 hypothetical protein [Crossiella cryophila]